MNERKRPTLEEETIIKLTPRWLQEAVKTAFSGILQQEEKKRIASKSRIIASNKDRRIVLKKKKRVLSNVTEKRNRQEIANQLGIDPSTTIESHIPSTLKMEPSTSTTMESHTSNTMAPSTLKMESSTSTTMESHTSNTMAPSTLKMEPSTSTTMESHTSNTMAPSTLKMEPSTSTTMESHTSNTMARSSLKMEPSTSTTMESHTSNNMTPSTLKMEPSTSTTMEMESCTSTTVKPSTSSLKPFTAIPEKFEWIRAVSTVEERQDFFAWVRAKADKIKPTDPDESMRLLLWAESLSRTIFRYSAREDFSSFLRWGLSTSTKEAPDERKRLLKWAHSTARVAAPDERKRWSLQEEILKPFETAVQHIQSEMNDCGEKYAMKHGFPKHKHGYPHVNQEHIIYTFKGKPGHYECRNALWIWTKYFCFYGILTRELQRGPVYFGEKIQNNFPESDMIEGRPSVNELGFVTIELSGKWIAKSIHKMLKDGLYTWAPKIPVDRVYIDRPSIFDRTHVDGARGGAIVLTLLNILHFSNVDALIPTKEDPDYFERNAKLAQLNKWFPLEEREVDVLIKGQIPFILPKRDFEKAYDDIFHLWRGLCNQKADCIVYITSEWQHVYLEMCLAAAELEKWIPIDGHKTTRANFAGYQACNAAALEVNLLDKAITCLGGAADLLGYSAEAILECVLKYTSLKKHRLAICTFDIDEMFNDEGNTFMYLLNTLAELRGITDDYREDINEVKKASELKIEKDKGWESGEERILGFHLLEFTEALEESCSSVLPHILCEYVYDLSKKFNRYHSSVCKDGFVVETSTLLLYEATAVVMEKCFQILDMVPSCYPVFRLSVSVPNPSVERPMDVNAGDPHRNSRFQPFSFWIKPMTLGVDEDSKLFGLISVSNKHGLLSDGSHFFEPDFAHFSLFDHDWLNPIDMTDGELVYLRSPSVPLSSFSSFISVWMELYVTKKDECYQVCKQNKVIDLSNFWGKKLAGECGCLLVQVEEGFTSMYYILLKDAVDTTLEVEFVVETNFLDREVGGYVVAYYGDEFLYDGQCEHDKDCYFSLLFLPKPPYLLQAGKVGPIKSQLAVPTTGSLIVKAYLEDFHSGEVIMNGTCKLKARLGGSVRDTISGSEGCCLNLKVVWNPQDSYL